MGMSFSIFIMNRALCSECRRQPSLFICFCAQTELCSDCVSVHLKRKPNLLHQTIPLEAGTLVAEIRAEEASKSDLNRIKSGLETRLNQVKSLQESALSKLNDAKKQWIDEIETATEEISRLVVSKCEEFACEIRRKIEELESEIGNGWEVEVPSIDLTALLSVLVPKNTCGLYRFYGGRNHVGVFHVSGAHWEMKQTEEKFMHNMSWTGDMDGNVYLTGGSERGISQKDVFRYISEENKIIRMASMGKARRSHCSLVLSSVLYVFGGMESGETLRSSEKLEISTGTAWEPLPDLIYARAYCGCVGYKGAIFIAGGCVEAAMEVYLPRTNAFLCFVLPKVELNEACCMVSLDHSILIFHGNNESEVYEYHPETGSSESLGLTGQGSLWSGCNPVFFHGKVYLLRHDTILTYTVDTKKCAFLSRCGRPRHSEEGEVV